MALSKVLTDSLPGVLYVSFLDGGRNTEIKVISGLEKKEKDELKPSGPEGKEKFSSLGRLLGECKNLYYKELVGISKTRRKKKGKVENT